jgi:uncharacterized membrane protein YphA (DoxX/SURF4 family)
MDILFYIASVVIGGAFNFVAKPDEKIVYKLAVANLVLSITLIVCTWLLAGITNQAVTLSISFVLDLARSLGHFIIGYLLFYIFLDLRSAKSSYDSYQLKSIINISLWSITIATGNAFIMSAINKATHFSSMSLFFTGSGYKVWFLYFIMAAEALGGLGLLLHFKLKTGPVAAIGLMLIMLGAVYTLWHNKDSFSDTEAALSHLVTLSLILVFYYFEKRV